MGHSEKHIAPLLLGGIIAAGASLAGNAIGASSQNKTNQTNIDINHEKSLHWENYKNCSFPTSFLASHAEFEPAQH